MQSAYIPSQSQIGLCDVGCAGLALGGLHYPGGGRYRVGVGPGLSYMLLFEMGRDCFSLDPVPELNK